MRSTTQLNTDASLRLEVGSEFGYRISMGNERHSEVPPTRTEEIRQLLADEIVRGRLLPGVPLEEAEIARKFNVSRTPVREAIRQLEAMGLAEARPRRGAVVAVISKERLDEMFFVMLEMEALCAREAAERMTRPEVDALVALNDKGGTLVASGDVSAYYLHNLAFHDAIYSGSHNAYLAETTLAVRKRLAPFRHAQFSGGGRPAHSQHEHDEVVAAIRAGNSTEAAAAMRRHISTVREAYETLVPLYGAR
jgi:DNA-binding GntR family transcriptional regulator